MPNVIPFPQPVPAAPAAADAGPHDWLLPHMAELQRYCTLNDLEPEATALAGAIEGLIAARQTRPAARKAGR